MNFQTKVVRGQPLDADGRRLVPVVRQTTGTWQKALVGSHHVSAQGGGFVKLQPIGIAEEYEGEEQFTPIPDRTNQILLGILGVAFVVPLLLWLGVQLSHGIERKR